MNRHKHSLSHYNLFSADMGELLPIGITEVLPGDSIQQATSCLIRVSPLLAPVMHPVSVRIHHWYMPFRIVWEEFEDFITAGPDGTSNPVFPTITLDATTADTGTLADYLGVPKPTGNVEVSALPFRCMAAIWNEWYRDEDLQALLPLSTASGADTTTSTALQNVAWEKDYFTSSRPWTQKGPEVTLPLSGDAPVTGLASASQTWSAGPVTVYETDGSGSTTYEPTQYSWDNNSLVAREDPNNTGFPDIRADLSAVTAASINDVRLAFALQRYQEARARYGSRYTEYLRYLGVRSSDARLQRPEYLGGGRQTIQFSEVLSTTPAATPTLQEGLATMGGHGITAVRSNRYRRFIEEHGYVITCLSVLPKTIYTQGVCRSYNRRTKEDFWQKELQNIGQQEVQNVEIYADSASPKGVFGYQDRYDEYRRTPSRVCGEFRTSDLDYWHMARTFATEPVLNGDFVKSNPTKRINAVQTNDVLWCMANHSIQARRLVSPKGTSYVF